MKSGAGACSYLLDGTYGQQFLLPLFMNRVDPGNGQELSTYITCRIELSKEFESLSDYAMNCNFLNNARCQTDQSESANMADC